MLGSGACVTRLASYTNDFYSPLASHGQNAANTATTRANQHERSMTSRVVGTVACAKNALHGYSLPSQRRLYTVGPMARLPGTAPGFPPVWVAPDPHVTPSRKRSHVRVWGRVPSRPTHTGRDVWCNRWMTLLATAETTTWTSFPSFLSAMPMSVPTLEAATCSATITQRFTIYRMVSVLLWTVYLAHNICCFENVRNCVVRFFCRQPPSTPRLVG